MHTKFVEFWLSCPKKTKAFTPPEATTISELTGQHQVLNTSPTAGLTTNWWDMRHNLTVLPPSEDCTSCTVVRSGKRPVGGDFWDPGPMHMFLVKFYTQPRGISVLQFFCKPQNRCKTSILIFAWQILFTVEVQSNKKTVSKFPGLQKPKSLQHPGN